MEKKNKIKIIHIIPTLDTGGAERLVVDIIKNLDKEKFLSEIICLKRFGWWGVELKKENIALTLLKQKHGFNFFALFKLVKILRAKKPDIVHTHLFGADFYGGLAAWLAGSRVLISTEHNLNYNESAIKKYLKKIIYKKFNCIIAVSEAVRGYLLKQGIDKEKIRVIYNGVDIAKFAERGKNAPNGKIIIGSAGRLSKQKGFDILIKALSFLDKEFLCQIAGEGEMKSKLQKQIKKLQLGDRIKLLGKVNDMPSFFGQLDIFVLPSRWEGFGLVILEAGLAGVPVVAANVDGIKEIIDNDEDGLLFRNESAENLAEKIKILISNPARRTKMAANLREKVIRKFSLEKMIREYENLYLDIL